MTTVRSARRSIFIGYRASVGCCIDKGELMEPDNTSNSDELVVEDLVEEISIDGMCGVY